MNIQGCQIRRIGKIQIKNPFDWWSFGIGAGTAILGNIITSEFESSATANKTAKILTRKHMVKTAANPAVRTLAVWKIQALDNGQQGVTLPSDQGSWSGTSFFPGGETVGTPSDRNYLRQWLNDVGLARINDWWKRNYRNQNARYEYHSANHKFWVVAMPQQSRGYLYITASYNGPVMANPVDRPNVQVRSSGMSFEHPTEFELYDVSPKQAGAEHLVCPVGNGHNVKRLFTLARSEYEASVLFEKDYCRCGYHMGMKLSRTTGLKVIVPPNVMNELNKVDDDEE
jgi:hypothetical protein